jgi:hypothetical protein
MNWQRGEEKPERMEKRSCKKWQNEEEDWRSSLKGRSKQPMKHRVA